MNAYERLQAFNKTHKESGEVYKAMQQWYLKHSVNDGVFCPAYEVAHLSPTLSRLQILQGMKSKQFPFPDYQNYRYVNELQVFGTWRNSLGVYKIDDNVIDDVVSSPIPTDTPVNIFARLPEWCVYVDTTNSKVLSDFHGASILGFWAVFDYHYLNDSYERVLKIVLNIDFNKFGGQSADLEDILPILELPIDNDMTINNAVKYLYQSTLPDDPFLNATDINNEVATLQILLAILLWLCAEEPDISNIVGEPVSKDQLRLPKYEVNKKTGVFIPPNQPIIYNIGQRLGGEVRGFNERINSGDSRKSSKKRPHIRKGHWHGVWQGIGQDKQFKVYWQPAIFVNAG